MSDPQIYWFDGDDPEMAAASRRARDGFRYFWRELSWEYRRIVPGLDLASVKVAFSDPLPPGSLEKPMVEHMWLGEVMFDGRQVRGRLLNSPNKLTSVAEGDQVAVAFERVGDWMYALSGRVYGAFTVNLLRSRMSPAERRAHDRAWGFDFGDPEDIQLVPVWGTKVGVMGRLFGKSAVADPDAEHPMSVNMGSSLQAALEQDASLLSQRNEDGFTMLHHLALGGSADGVRIALEFGADRTARTVHELRPIDLAQSMGWPRVVALLE